MNEMSAQKRNQPGKLNIRPHPTFLVLISSSAYLARRFFPVFDLPVSLSPIRRIFSPSFEKQLLLQLLHFFSSLFLFIRVVALTINGCTRAKCQLIFIVTFVGRGNIRGTGK